MSGYILCQTKKADKPFFVESINTNIYSLEELCYFLYHNLSVSYTHLTLPTTPYV